MSASQQPTDIRIAPEMIEAGVSRFRHLLEAGVGSAYLVEEVFRAMWSARNSGVEGAQPVQTHAE